MDFHTPHCSRSPPFGYVDCWKCDSPTCSASCYLLRQDSNRGDQRDGTCGLTQESSRTHTAPTSIPRRTNSVSTRSLALMPLHIARWDIVWSVQSSCRPGTHPRGGKGKRRQGTDMQRVKLVVSVWASVSNHYNKTDWNQTPEKRQRQGQHPSSLPPFLPPPPSSPLPPSFPPRPAFTLFPRGGEGNRATGLAGILTALQRVGKHFHRYRIRDGSSFA